MMKNSGLPIIGLTIWNIVNQHEERPGRNPRPFSCFIGSCLPRIATTLANAHCLVDGLDLLLLRHKNSKNQRRDGEEEPLDGNPPPTDEQPPENSVVLILQLGFCNHLNIHIIASAFRTYHFAFSFPFQSIRLKDGYILMP
jgi:hypothetical protein